MSKSAHLEYLRAINISKKASAIKVVQIDPHGSSYKCILPFKMRVKDPSILLFGSSLSRRISRSSQAMTLRLQGRISASILGGSRRAENSIFSGCRRIYSAGCYLEETTPRLAHSDLAFRYSRGWILTLWRSSRQKRRFSNNNEA